MKFFALLLLPLLSLGAAGKELTFYLTANTGGRFPLDNDLQENELMRLAAYLPSAEGLYHTRIALHERLAFFWYGLNDESPAGTAPTVTPAPQPGH